MLAAKAKLNGSDITVLMFMVADSANYYGEAIKSTVCLCVPAKSADVTYKVALCIRTHGMLRSRVE